MGCIYRCHSLTVANGPPDAIKYPKTSCGHATHEIVRHFKGPGSIPVHIPPTEPHPTERIEIVNLKDCYGCIVVWDQQTGQYLPTSRPRVRPLTLRELWDQVQPEDIIPGCILDSGKVKESKRVGKTNQTASVIVEQCHAVTTEPTSFLSHLTMPAQPGRGHVYKVMLLWLC